MPDGGVSEIVDTPQAFIVVKFWHINAGLKDVAAEIKNKLETAEVDAEIEAMKRNRGLDGRRVL